jgi:hypothetical protein
MRQGHDRRSAIAVMKQMRWAVERSSQVALRRALAVAGAALNRPGALTPWFSPFPRGLKSRRQNRSTLARISSAVFVHTNGFECALAIAMYSSVAWSSSPSRPAGC